MKKSGNGQWAIGKSEKPWRRAFFVFAIAYCLLPIAWSFELPKEAVYPRIFTPNGDGINDRVSFNVANPSLETLEGKIYDREGSLVAEIGFDVGFTQGLWNGLDRNGNVARAGVYIFEVSSGGKSVTGTVVVAK